MNKLLPFLLVTVVMLGGTACGGPRKACRSAEGLLARAVQKCPDLLQAHVEHDTVQVLIPGHGASGETGYTAADMDSVVALCNELLNKALTEENKRAQLRNAAPQTERLVDRMRVQLCDLESVTHADSLIQLKVWTANGKLQYWYRVLPRIVDVGVTTTVPQVVAKDCPPQGVASWYRTALWWTWGIMLVFLLVIGYLIHRSSRYIMSLGLVLVASASMAQDVPLSAYGGWHYPPPPMNLVCAGQLLEQSSIAQRDAVYVALAGVLVGAVLHTQNETLGYAVGGLAVGYSLRLNLVGSKRTRKAGQWLQQNYNGQNTYDVVPDSLGQAPLQRVTPK